MITVNNKSATYLLPLVLRSTDKFLNYMGRESFPSNLYHNTYIYHTEIKDFIPRIFIVYKYVQNPIYDVFENKFLLSNPNFERKRQDNNLVTYSFKIPDNFIDDYCKIIEGKYSKISKDAKNKILLFLNLKKFEEENKNSDIVSVLYKTEYYRELLQTKLGVKIHDSYELSSIIDVALETFNPVHYLIIQSHE